MKKMYHMMWSINYKHSNRRNKFMMEICLNLIIRGLSRKLAKKCTFKFNSKSLKQVHGCAMGGPLSVTFSEIYLVKMEKVAVRYHLNLFYSRSVDDIYSRQKLGDNVLFDWLNNYHPNIKLTIEVNPIKFLDTKLTNINCTYKFNVYRKNTKLPSPWTSKTPKRYKWNTLVIFIVQKEYHQTLTKKSLW